MAARMPRCSSRSRAAVASQSSMTARPGLHVALDRRAQAGHHRRHDLVAGCRCQRHVERGVERQELLRGELGGVHRVEQALRRLQVGARGVGDVGHDSGLQHEAGLHDVAHAESLGRDLQAEQRAHGAVRGGDDDGAGARAGSGLGADEAHRLEHAHGLAHAGASDAEIRRESALGREVIAGGEGAVEQLSLDVREHGLPGAEVVDGGGDGRCVRRTHSGTASLWSDHISAVVRPHATLTAGRGRTLRPGRRADRPASYPASTGGFCARYPRSDMMQ